MIEGSTLLLAVAAAVTVSCLIWPLLRCGHPLGHAPSGRLVRCERRPVHRGGHATSHLIVPARVRDPRLCRCNRLHPSVASACECELDGGHRG